MPGCTFAGPALGLWTSLLPPSSARPRGCPGLHRCRWLCSGRVLPGRRYEASPSRLPAGRRPCGAVPHLPWAPVPHTMELNSCFTSLAQQGRVRSSPDIYGTALSLIARLGLVCWAIKAPLFECSLGALAGLPHPGRSPTAVRTRTAHSNHFASHCALGLLTQSRATSAWAIFYLFKSPGLGNPFS